jgi:hypothetical protein
MDDSGVNTMQKHGMQLRRQASETNLAVDFQSGKGGKFSRGINPGQQAIDAGKRAKSPFSIFKRVTSREPSPMRAGDMQSDSLPVRITVSILFIA